MRTLSAVIAAIPLLCAAKAPPGKKPDLSLLFTVVKTTKTEVVARITIENSGQVPMRVLLPSFSPFRYWPHTAHGGYGPATIDDDGRVSKIPQPKVPGAAPGPIREKDTIVLQPGMSVGKLVQLRGPLAVSARQTRLAAYYNINVVVPRGLAMPWNDKARPPLWKGSITSAALSTANKNTDASNNPMQTTPDG